ncbi:unnamed protein product [Effrenium voratum]|nr:unnamed protein product [Effrenium voratum]
MLGVNHEAQAASMNRVAASSALRSVILAATACSGAANAASSAAEELAELRANFRRNAEARRSNSAPYLSLSRMKERDPEGLAKVQENGQAAQARDGTLERSQPP